MMKTFYIGIKMIEAEPMVKDGNDGYRVVYKDGYESWSPKDVFEKAYLKLIARGDTATSISISKEMVDAFIKETHIYTLGEKTTVVRAVLRNGFEIVESSSCVDPANYSEAMGAEICLEKIKGKIWGFLGFFLQTAVNGI